MSKHWLMLSGVNILLSIEDNIYPSLIFYNGEHTIRQIYITLKHLEIAELITIKKVKSKRRIKLTSKGKQLQGYLNTIKQQL